MLCISQTQLKHFINMYLHISKEKELSTVLKTISIQLVDSTLGGQKYTHLAKSSEATWAINPIKPLLILMQRQKFVKMVITDHLKNMTTASNCSSEQH